MTTASAAAMAAAAAANAASRRVPARPPRRPTAAALAHEAIQHGLLELRRELGQRHIAGLDPVEQRGQATELALLPGAARTRLHVHAHLGHLLGLECTEHVAPQQLLVGRAAAHRSTSISSSISLRLRSA